MDRSDFNKNREILKIKNYEEFVSQEKLKKPEWLKIKISPNRQTLTSQWFRGYLAVQHAVGCLGCTVRRG